MLLCLPAHAQQSAVSPTPQEHTSPLGASRTISSPQPKQTYMLVHGAWDVPQPAKTFSQPISLKNPAAKSVPGVYILTVDPGKKPEEDAFFKFYQRAKDRGWATRIMEGDHVVSVSHLVELVKLLEEGTTEAKAAVTH